MVCTEFECLSDRDSLYEIKGGSQYELRVSHAMCERMDLCNQIMPQTGAQVESVSARHPAYESGALDSVLHMAECITEWTSGAQALTRRGLFRVFLFRFSHPLSPASHSFYNPCLSFALAPVSIGIQHSLASPVTTTPQTNKASRTTLSSDNTTHHLTRFT